LAHRVLVWKLVAIECDHLFSHVIKSDLNGPVKLLLGQVKGLVDPIKLKSNDPDDRNRTQNDSQPDMVVFHEGKIKQIDLTVEFFPVWNKKS
jgi:hypothetical protein